MKQRVQRILHLLFRVGVALKGIDAILELAGGVILLLFSPKGLEHFVQNLFQHELAQDQHDVIANYLLHITQDLSQSAEFFWAMYLLGHGVVKAGIVGGLWQNKLWAFPVAGVVLVGYVVFQSYRLAHRFTFLLFVLTVTDLFVFGMLRFEYNRAKREAERAESASRD